MSDDRDPIPAKLRLRYPSPLDWLLVSLYERNQDYWFQPAMNDTVGAERVRKHGLTENQMRWAEEISEQMDGDHPAYEDMNVPHVEDDEILSDLTAEDVIGDVE